MNKQFSLVFISFLFLMLVSCREGRFVDKTSPGFVDKQPAGSIDTGIRIELATNDTVINQTDKDFVPPPGNFTQNATITISEKQAFIGKDVVKLWVWNDRGSQVLLMTEATTLTIPRLQVTIEAALISHQDGGQVKILVNGKPAKTLSYKQEIRIGDTWVFVSDLFLNEQEQ